MMTSLVHVFENYYSRTVFENIDTSFLCFLKTAICFLNSVFFVFFVFSKTKKKKELNMFSMFSLFSLFFKTENSFSSLCIRE